MTKTKALYGFLCALAVVAGLYPCIYLNVKPWWMHDRGMAVVQLFLTLITAAIPLIIHRLRWVEAIIAAALLLVLLRVSVANGIESVTLTRSEISQGRQEKLDTKSEWNTRIEGWTNERDGLKARFIPLGGEAEYAPTSEVFVATAREGRDSANRARDAACKISPTECKNLTQRADTAQNKLEQVTQNFELTKRIDQLERDIREAQGKLRIAGAPPPDHFAQARNALDGAWLNPLADREAWLAYAAEGAAAFSPKFLVFLISFLFVAALGENWWRDPQPNRESLQFKRESPPQEQRIEPASKPRKPFGLAYVPGFKAWMATARPAPGGPRKRYTPGAAFPHYRDFCQERGFEPAKHVTTFGSLMKSYSELAPVVKTGGQSYYELNLGPQLALVKA